MLILARRKDQQTTIGEHISITIVEIRGDRVRLGISAPEEVPVHRKEVKDAIDAGHSLSVFRLRRIRANKPSQSL